MRRHHSLAALLLGFALGNLVAVAGDPLADIGVLQDIDVVVKGGLVFRMPLRSVQPPSLLKVGD